jgi:hypothetical protein
MEREPPVNESELNDRQWCIEDNPRWPYDKFMRTYFGKPLQFKWVRQKHDRTLADLRQTAIEPFESRARHLPTLQKLEQAGLQGLFEFLDAVSTLDQAERLMEQTGIDRDEMEDWLDFVKRRWFIPQMVQLRQLFDTSDQALFAHFQALKQHKVSNTYVLLVQRP